MLILTVLQIVGTSNSKFPSLGSDAFCNGGGELSAIYSWVSNAVL